MQSRTWLVAGSRCLVLVGLAFWLGGLVFLGAVAAPLIFQFCRAHHVAILAPQMVGAMVTRFNLVTYVCGVLLVLGWLGEAGGRAVGASRKLWWTQGVCSTLMLLIALSSGLVLMPRLHVLQAQLLPQLARTGLTTPASPTLGLNPREAALKATFDAAHQHYQQIAMVAWWLGVVTLLALAVRTTLAEERTLLRDGRRSG